MVPISQNNKPGHKSLLPHHLDQVVRSHHEHSHPLVLLERLPQVVRLVAPGDYLLLQLVVFLLPSVLVVQAGLDDLEDAADVVLLGPPPHRVCENRVLGLLDDIYALFDVVDGHLAAESEPRLNYKPSTLAWHSLISPKRVLGVV